MGLSEHKEVAASQTAGSDLSEQEQERRQQRRGSPDDVYDDTPPKVVCINDGRFRVRRPAVLAAPRR